MSQSTESRNKALVIEAFDTLFNKRDYAAAERFWSSNYVQHSAHIEPGSEGLFNLIKASPASLKYEPGVIVADGEAKKEGAALGAICTPPGDAQALAGALRQLAALDTATLRGLGESGKSRVEERADRAGIMRELAGRIVALR